MKIKCIPTEYTVVTDNRNYRIIREPEDDYWSIAEGRSMIVHGCYETKTDALNDLKYYLENGDNPMDWI